MMKEINSINNKKYKLCIQLEHKKYRDRYGLYLIEGTHLLEEAAKAGAILDGIFLREGYAFCQTQGMPETFVLAEKIFKNIAQTETSQGIVAIARKRQWEEADFFERCRGKNVLILDRIQDPGNIGTMIRTADAAGYAGVMALKGTGDLYAPKAVRAAAGSLFRLPVLFVDTPGQALELLRKYGKKTVSACFDTERLYFQETLQRDIALLIGNEGGGLCQEFIHGSDVRVRIPMDNQVDSLNAAVAAGILMYECRRTYK